MLDSAIAGFYGTGTKQVNQAVKRNPKKFPPDFCFQLTDEEIEFLRSQKKRQTLMAEVTNLN